MKRIGNVHSFICDPSNIDIADEKARRCKKNRYGIKRHDKNRIAENFRLSLDLYDNTFKTSEYTTFKIYEPKERIIFRLPYYPDRIVHHAVMNIMEPIWTKIFTRDTYSCIKGRGIHSLVKKLLSDLLNDPSGTVYCAKMDIRKFYPSINHKILKLIIRKKLKDKDTLLLLDGIIDSTDGVPIGNYLSQFFANLYLAYFDHWIKEELKVKYYYRYADDIVLLSDNKDLLRSWLLAIKIYLTNILDLLLKDNYQIFPVEARGIDFVGYVFRHKYTLLRKSIKLRMFKIIKKYKDGKISKDTFLRSICSYFGWLKYCNSKNLLKKIYKETGIRYSNWKGEFVKFKLFKGKTVYVVNILPKNKYFLILFIHNNKYYELKSHNIKLFNYLTGSSKLIKLR